MVSKKSKVKLISYNLNNVEVCASAARLSTTQGNALEIFERAKENEKNHDLVQKVLRSGHRSVIEHAVFNFALTDVSVFVEQFFIESRLASFTVKSRRYVDFSNFGYYIPNDLEEENRHQYCKYMDALFSAYHVLLDNGIPKEDARFLLPYSFHSNFYCTLNARELIQIINEMRYGRGKGIPELQDLAAELGEQAGSVFPCISSEIDHMPSVENVSAPVAADIVKVKDRAVLIEAPDIGAVRLLNKPSDPAGILDAAYRIQNPDASGPLKVDTLLRTGRPRELEQLSYTFMISNITLSGITHMVRHRMQSVMVPSIQGIEHSKFIIPDTIKNNAETAKLYKNVLETANELLKEMSQNQALKKYSYYYALSGNVLDIMTTINARELNHFIKLRACNRAQWEIRNIAVDILKYVRTSFPELFQGYGPSCYVTGKCPEGNMTCGEMGNMINKFKQLS